MYLNQKPTLRAISKSTIAVSWDHLVSNDTMECLDHVELRDGTGGKIGTVNETLQIMKRQSFIVDLDICKEHLEEFQLVFFFKDEGSNVSPVRISKTK